MAKRREFRSNQLSDSFLNDIAADKQQYTQDIAGIFPLSSELVVCRVYDAILDKMVVSRLWYCVSRDFVNN